MALYQNCSGLKFSRKRAPNHFGSSAIWILIIVGTLGIGTTAIQAAAAADVTIGNKLADMLRASPSLGQLTAGIAHEIKNPLNFVNNFANLSDELLHSREGPSEPESVNLNALAEEALNLTKPLDFTVLKDDLSRALGGVV